MKLLQLLFRVLRYSRDVKAVRRGRVPQRIWNRVVSHEGWKIIRRLYR